MKFVNIFFIGFFFLLLSWSGCGIGQQDVELFVTTADRTSLFQPISLRSVSEIPDSSYQIEIDTTRKFQVMDGFGVAITGSSCHNLLKMDPEDRTRLLKETFDPVEGVGYSFIRISIGCSDFSLDEYTCCDQPGIENFAIHRYDTEELFPILKEIRAIRPDIKILASPWTCPIWMKVDNLTDKNPFPSWTSGQLNPDYYSDYATYFVRFIEEMEKAGFPIYAVTIQNEPLNRGNSASLFMTWQEQRDFIKNALGPAFENAGIDTHIIVYDHNYNYDSHKSDCKDQIGYPTRIYDDPDAARYVTGAAYHAYGGDKSELKNIVAAHPEKGIYFTEMSIGLWGSGYRFADDLMWNMREVCLGTINLGNKAVIMWNYLLDDQHGPNRPGGCTICLGAIDIDSRDYKTLTRNSHFYTMAHLSKVVQPGAVRLATHQISDQGIYCSAFCNPDHSYSAVVQNDTGSNRSVVIRMGNRVIPYTLPAKSIASYRWK